MENTFEEVNHACCFNHTLQLLAKTLLKPFNAGMSSTKLALEEEESKNVGDEMPILLDSEDDSNEDSDKDGDDGNDRLQDADSDEIDELNQLNEQECETVLMNTAVV